MRSKLLGKLASVGAAIALLSMALMRIEFLVNERRWSEEQTIQNMQQSFTGASGPLAAAPAHRRVERDGGLLRPTHGAQGTPQHLHLQQMPTRLETSIRSSRSEMRYRVLLKVNG